MQNPWLPVLVMSMSVTFAETAYAEAPGAAASEPAHPSPPTTTSPPIGSWSWGWLLLGSGIAAGGALTTYGLAQGCSSGDTACERHASIAIWGGLGIASLSSMFGLAIVQSERARARTKTAAVSVAATGGPGVFLHGSF
jgi:hypothetical protein